MTNIVQPGGPDELFGTLAPGDGSSNTHPSLTGPLGVTILSGATLKAGDTIPELTAVLVDAAGAAVDLTGASVAFHMTNAYLWGAAVDGAAGVVDAPNGKIQYAWAAGDTAAAGDYLGEFRVTFSDNATATFPDGGYCAIKILSAIP